MRFLSILVLIMLLLAPFVAQAHAIIVESAPAINATVTGPEMPVSLKFNSRIDSKRSVLKLLGPDKQESVLHLCDSGPPVASSPVPVQVCTQDTLVAYIVGLTPGKYRLRWQVLSVDGHITRGDVPFTDVAVGQTP